MNFKVKKSHDQLSWRHTKLLLEILMWLDGFLIEA